MKDSRTVRIEVLFNTSFGLIDQVDMSSNQVGYVVLQLLLQTFPEKEHLYQADDEGLTPLHRAAYYGNHVAIDIIHSHVEKLKDRFDWNPLSANGLTPLDALGRVRNSVRVSEEELRPLHTIMKKNTITCFVKLRGHGGQFSRELNDNIAIV